MADPDEHPDLARHWTVPPLRTWPLSAWGVLLGNLSPVFGVVALGWDVAPLLLFYWLENLVVGGFTVLRMALSTGPMAGGQGASSGRTPVGLKLFLIPFFCAHFGLFCLVHGAFLVNFFLPHGGSLDPFAAVFDHIPEPWLFLLPIVLAHGVSFVVHDVRGGGLARTNTAQEMVRPYGRIFLMQGVVLVGGALAQGLGAPWPAVLLLAGSKGYLDVAAHLRLRRR